ncbi:hypothetical protein HDV57DRAFT_351611 [Trichoderma longibrachiatum]|uniref:Uncharacterized protein n=1 Tax=Trichoderma longibrachiatum ATCC 18648 TaxID=983965 RepID=A0A2T4BRC0_TRILO|nr:hypothetical protein M440DRAFT_1426165 [Trichoderma longibrachiatum ATCC 18648]
MADVRALLRQQRAARRITHPHATYSDTGKLLCTLCREQIRAESHWDAHLASDKHRKRLSATISTPTNVNGKDDYRGSEEGNDQEQSEGLDDAQGREQRAETPSSTHKRKLDHAAATAADGEHEDTDKDVDDEDEVRRKRSRHASPETGRRKPQGPSQGVQVQMPSRSTTPADSQHSGSSAAKTTTTTTAKLATSLPSRQASNLATPASSSSMSIQQEAPPSQQQQQQQEPQPLRQPPASTTQDQKQIDEDEWAAFEADIAAETAPYDADAVISRPAMTAEEAAAAAAREAEQEAALQNPESRRTRADADIEDEREEATRALEEEFEEMQELEARVQRLKEKREALMMRRRGETVVGQDQAEDDVASLQASTTKPSSDTQGEGKENAISTSDTNGPKAENNDEDDEEEDDDEEDDWDGFRFRTGR